ncbi:unnamed protein product [Closterium sp. NIES-53]
MIGCNGITRKLTGRQAVAQCQVALLIDSYGGYHQIRIKLAYCAKTLFRIRYKSFEYTVMPFGLTNVPATFQMTINEAFRPLVGECVIVYLDDILIHSQHKQQHFADLETVFFKTA